MANISLSELYLKQLNVQEFVFGARERRADGPSSMWISEQYKANMQGPSLTTYITARVYCMALMCPL